VGVVVVVGGSVVVVGGSVVVVGGSVVVVGGSVVVVGGSVVVVGGSVVVVAGGLVVVVVGGCVVVVGGTVVVVVVGNGSGSGNSRIGVPPAVVVVPPTEDLVEMTVGWVCVLPGLLPDELVDECEGAVVVVDEFSGLLKITIFGTTVVWPASGAVVVGVPSD
jgi:hypothetical protein